MFCAIMGLDVQSLLGIQQVSDLQQVSKYNSLEQRPHICESDFAGTPCGLAIRR